MFITTAPGFGSEGGLPPVTLPQQDTFTLEPSYLSGQVLVAAEGVDIASGAVLARGSATAEVVAKHQGQVTVTSTGSGVIAPPPPMAAPTPLWRPPRATAATLTYDRAGETRSRPNDASDVQVERVGVVAVGGAVLVARGQRPGISTRGLRRRNAGAVRVPRPGEVAGGLEGEIPSSQFISGLMKPPAQSLSPISVATIGTIAATPAGAFSQQVASRQGLLL